MELDSPQWVGAGVARLSWSVEYHVGKRCFGACVEI